MKRRPRVWQKTGNKKPATRNRKNMKLAKIWRKWFQKLLFHVSTVVSSKNILRKFSPFFLENKLENSFFQLVWKIIITWPELYICDAYLLLRSLPLPLLITRIEVGIQLFYQNAWKGHFWTVCRSLKRTHRKSRIDSCEWTYDRCEKSFPKWRICKMEAGCGSKFSFSPCHIDYII